MAEVGTAFLTIIPSARGFGAALNSQVGGQVDGAGAVQGRRFGGAFTGAFGAALKGAGGIIAAVGVAQLFKTAITGAADLQQSIGSIDTVFKSSAQQMHTWAKGAAQSVGLSRNEFNELGTLIGSQLKNGGTAMEELAPKTHDLIGLGADLASMYGGTTREAVEALSSALKGERDPIEKYGGSLNQAKIDAEAAKLGFDKVGGSLSSQATQAATLSLIYKQSADAVGNFSKENDTLAGKQQRLKAQWKDLTDTLGGVLVPKLTDLFGWLNDKVLPKLLEIGPTVKDAFKDVSKFVDEHETSIKVISGAIFTILIPAFIAWGVNAVRAAVLNTIAWVTAKWQAITSAATQLAMMTLVGLGWIIMGVRAVAGAAVQAGAWLVAKLGALSTIGAYILAFAVIAAGWIASGVVAMVNALIIAAAWLLAFWPVLLVVAIVAAAVALIIIYWDEIKAAAKALVTEISQEWDTFKEKTAAAWEAIKTKLSDAWEAIKTTVKTKITEVVTFVKELPDKITTALANSATWLIGVGEDIINGLIKGIGNGFDWVRDKIVALGGNVTQWAKEALGIGSPSKVMAREVGRWIPAGIAVGIDANADDVRSSMAGLTTGLSTTAHLGLRAGRSVTGAAAATTGPRPVRVFGELELVGSRALITGVISEELVATA